MKDLWPDDVADGTEAAPVAILRHQASKLRKRTRKLVIAQVDILHYCPSDEPFYRRLLEVGFPQEYMYAFNIVAPTLGSYPVCLFYSFYDPEGYPAGFNFRPGLSEDYGRQLDRFRLGKGYEHPLSPFMEATNQVFQRGRPDYENDYPSDYIFVARDSSEFVTILGAILQAPETKKLVRELLSQVSDLGSATSDLWE